MCPFFSVVGAETSRPGQASFWLMCWVLLMCVMSDVMAGR